MTLKNFSNRSVLWCLAALLSMLLIAGCSQQSQSAGGVKKAASKDQSGFLKDYSKLKPNPKFEETVLTFVTDDAKQDLRNYDAIIVEPVEVILATDADASKVPTAGMAAISRYFHHALVKAVSDVYPVTDKPGPLVLKLRAAIVGVAAGAEIPASGKQEDAKDAMPRGVKIDQAIIELELTDSETGNVIAAVVDKAALTPGTEVGAVNFTRMEKFAAAKEACNNWAGRVRAFLDSAVDLTPEQAEKRLKSYQPYGE